MSIDVLKSGLLSTIQDAGRYGYQHKGVSPAGAMDQRSMRIANVLVGSDENNPCIEMTYIGLTMHFNESMTIAISGAIVPVRINGKDRPMNQSLHLISGDLLEIGSVSKGVYSYIAFSKCLIADKVLGSYSTDCNAGIGGLKGRKLMSGDTLFFLEEKKDYRLERTVDKSLVTSCESSSIIRFVEGCEYDFYSKEAHQRFEEEAFLVTERSDRMGYRLSGSKIHAKEGNDILSDGLTIGTIQGTANGEFIVMLADRQTTGGYSRIAHVISVDLPKFTQLKSGSSVRFKKISLDEAHSLMRDEEEQFTRWKDNLERKKRKKIIDEKQMHIGINGKHYNIKIEEVE